jgi:hypothetical protein
MSYLGVALSCVAVGGCATRSGVYQDTDDREGIRKVIFAHHKELRHCYQDALERESMLEGKLVLGWSFDSSGKVLDAHVVSANNRIEPVAPCVIENLKTWSFPPAASGSIVDVSYPFFFSENGKFMVNGKLRESDELLATPKSSTNP